jgi:hypothetical protein
MKYLLTIIAATAIALSVGMTGAHAQELATANTRVRMVRAFCTTGPCVPGVNFEHGAAQLKRMIQPKPFARRKIGRLRLLGVQSSPLPSSLTGAVTARFVWDTVDPDGDCPELGADVVQTLATTSMFCSQQVGQASCGGDLLVPLGLFDPRCTDVRLTLHDLRFEVFEFGMLDVDASRIARDGISIPAQGTDCSSGGPGCP